MSDIEISPNDKRQYYYLKLSNDLDCLLVSDPLTEKSSACCDVGIGSMADPKEAPGLAHFLEHMLFLGTETYPVENAYSSYLSSHGGDSNAYTDQEDTVYYFSVQSEFFEEALNMFASFFICPLFTETAVDREMNAVDSENSKNIQNDTWRQYQLFKGLCSPEHPFSSFSTGNLETLKTIPESNQLNTRNLMIEFYENHYSSNRMKLVIYGKESIATLQKWAESKFSKIKNRNLPPSHVPPEPFKKDQLSRFVQFVPVKDIKEVDVVFPLPSLQPLYLSKPHRYISHLVGHESDGSILAALKSKGLVNGLSAMTDVSNKDFATFRVRVELTDAGIERVDEVVSCIFAYLGMLSREGVQMWILEELRDIMAMSFRFEDKMEPSHYATILANNMQNFPPKHYLTGEKLVHKLDLDPVKKLLSYLNPDRALILTKHRGFRGQTSHIEKWYGTEYNIAPFSEQQLKIWSASYAGKNLEWESSILHLPKPNPFVASDFAIRANSGISRTVSPEQSLRTIPTVLCVIGSDSKKEIFVKTAWSLGNESSILIELGSWKDTDGDAPDATYSPAASNTQLVPEDPAALIAVDTSNSTWQDSNGTPLLVSPPTTIITASANENVDEGTSAELPAGPICTLHSTSMVTWFKQDLYWRQPKLNVVISLESVTASSTPLAIALTELMADSLKEVLNEYAYYADCAELRYDISMLKGGLCLLFSGFQHKLPVLVEKTLDELKGLTNHSSTSLTDEVFSRIKEKLMRRFANEVYKQPYYHALVGALNCLEEPRWAFYERFHALKDVSKTDLVSFATQFLRHTKIEFFACGNLSVEEANGLSRIISSKLGTSVLPISQYSSKRVVRLTPGIEYIYKQHAKDFNPDEKNSAIENTYIIGDLEGNDYSSPVQLAPLQSNRLKKEALLELTVQLLREPAFDQLRTKEQLGYIVFTSIKKFSGYIGLHIIVQSDHKDSTYLNCRIEEFLKSFRAEKLVPMTQEEFDTYVQAVIETLLEKPKNLDEESTGYWEEMKAGTYLFSRKVMLVEVLRSLKLSDVVAFFDEFIFQANSRTKFSSQFCSVTSKSVYAVSQPSQTDITTATTDLVSTTVATIAAPVVDIKDHALFKRSMPLHPVSAYNFAL